MHNDRRASDVAATEEAVNEFASRLDRLGWVSDLWAAGSWAMGDYVPGVSDLDLVAVVDGSVTPDKHEALRQLHRDLDAGIATGLDLGCVYVHGSRLNESVQPHPTWTHWSFTSRVLSGVTRAELLRYGRTLRGRQPSDVLAPMDPEVVRAAAVAELNHYWAWAVRRPVMWLDPVIADLGLSSMARARYTLSTGELLTKSAAIEQAAAPAWLVADLRARRRGERVTSPRIRTAVIAWRDARRTVALTR
jgi:hypothetical protein